jgi:hypothetical protein
MHLDTESVILSVDLSEFQRLDRPEGIGHEKKNLNEPATVYPTAVHLTYNIYARVLPLSSPSNNPRMNRRLRQASPAARSPSYNPPDS